MPMASASAQPIGTLSQMPVTPQRRSREQIGQRHADAQRSNGQDDRHHAHMKKRGSR